MEGWKKVFHTNGNQKKATVAILISDKLSFKIKIVKRNKGHYIMIKGSIQEEVITIVRIYALNIGAPKYIKQILTDIKGEIDSNTIKVGNFKTPLITMDRASRQKINRETLALSNTLDQMEIIYIYRTFHQKTAENTLSSRVYGTISRTDCILGHKSSLSKFLKIEIISGIFADHNAM